MKSEEIGMKDGTWRPAYKQSKLRIIYDTFDEVTEMSEVQMTASP